MFGYKDIFLLSWKDLSKKDIQTRYPWHIQCYTGGSLYIPISEHIQTWISCADILHGYPYRFPWDIHDISNVIHVDLYISMYLNISKHGYLVWISCADILTDFQEISMTYPWGSPYIYIYSDISNMDILCGYLAWIS